jgi:hypothetical protein
MRSVYFKSLVTQLTIMLATNISQSGIPVDRQNGYLRDFYEVGAGFMMLNHFNRENIERLKKRK